MDPLGFVDAHVRDLRERGLFRQLPVLQSPQGPRIRIGGRELINMSSNDYLGLANDAALREAAMAGAETWGGGAGAVRTIAGTLDVHQALESEIAAWKGVEATLVFQSGFAGNLGTIPALVGRGDVILSDELNHASIIDGCRLSRAEIRRFAHADADSLREQLAACTPDQRKLVVTDGVFSMDGDIAPLPDICDAAEAFGAMVMVDDAHGSGVLGRGGRGSVDHFGLHGRVQVQLGTLSKAIGSMGGYIAGSQALRDYLTHTARPVLFSTSHPPAVVETTRASIRVLTREPERVERLWDNARFFKQGLSNLGMDLGRSATPITPVIVGEAERAHALSDRLRQRGIFVQSVAFPTVPRDAARVRAMVSAAHSRDDLAQAVDAFGEAMRGL
ncbi:MAG: glycine C-acetyltransferase [Chloroflexota bacterium]|nr:glycine C-acetyltransferase [Chloroflexota bacterium]